VLVTDSGTMQSVTAAIECDSKCEMRLSVVLEFRVCRLGTAMVDAACEDAG
jgi:hypothetical protein